MHNSFKKNWKLNTKQVENTLWLMWLLAKMHSQTKMNHNFAMHNEYLIIFRGEAQDSFYICENMQGPKSQKLFVYRAEFRRPSRTSSKISDFYEHCRQAE